MNPSIFWKSIRWILLTLTSVYVIVTLYWISGVSNQSKPFERIRLPFNTSCENITVLAAGIDMNQLTEKFPYHDYLAKNSLADPSCLASQSVILDSLYSDAPGKGQEVIFIALTDSLRNHFRLHLRTYSPDTILSLLHWASAISDYSKLDPSTADLMEAVADYWFNNLAKNLSALQKREKEIKFDFRFRYISERLKEKGYLVNSMESKVEKFKTNLTAGNWAHLMSATWNDSGFMLRTTLGFLSVLLLLGMASIVSLILYLTNKK